MMRVLRLLALLPALLLPPLLCACAHGGALENTTSAPTTPAATTVTPSLANAPSCQTNITLQGRLSARYQTEGRQQSLSVAFQWQQRGDAVQVLLTSPLGQGVAKISSDAQGASLTDDKGQVWNAVHVDALSEKLLGWPLPVAGLRDWLQGCGRLRDGSSFRATPQGTDSYFSDGWLIRYAQWHDNGQPKRIDLERHINEQSADVALRILLDAP